MAKQKPLTKEKMDELADKYIESKAMSWSPVTAQKERCRFSNIEPIHVMDAKLLYTHLKDERKLKPYSIKIVMTRIGEFVEFLMAQGVLAPGRNHIKSWMREHANLFKHAYVKKPVSLLFSEVERKVSTMHDEESKALAQMLMATGLRFEESQTLNPETNMVVGKGGKSRQAYLPPGMTPVKYSRTYHTFLRHLKEVGLTPHMLRKVSATEAVELGAQAADLLAIFGWNSMETASAYLTARNKKAVMGKLHDKLKRKPDNDDE